MDAVADEIRLTMFLLFLRTDESRRIAEKLFSKMCDRISRRPGFWRDNSAAKDTIRGMSKLSWVQNYHKSGRDFRMKGTFHLRQFRHYPPPSRLSARTDEGVETQKIFRVIHARLLRSFYMVHCDFRIGIRYNCDVESVLFHHSGYLCCIDVASYEIKCRISAGLGCIESTLL